MAFHNLQRTWAYQPWFRKMTEYEIYVVVVFFCIEFSSWESCRTILSAYDPHGPTVSRLVEMALGKTSFDQVPQGDPNAHAEVGQPLL